MYCSRECQKLDWREHAKYCKLYCKLKNLSKHHRFIYSILSYQLSDTCFGPINIRYEHRYFSISLVLEDFRSMFAKGPAAVPYLSEEESEEINLMVLDYRSLTYFRVAHLFADASYLLRPAIKWRAGMSFRDIQRRFSLKAHWYTAVGEAMYVWDSLTQHGEIDERPISKMPVRECNHPVGAWV
jgi:hypothetical protein